MGRGVVEASGDQVKVTPASGRAKVKARLLMLAAMVITCTLLVSVMAACAPKERSDSDEEAASSSSETTVTVAWSEDSDCSVCHASQAESTSDTACLVSEHTDLDCISCHDDVDALAEIHEERADSNPERLTTLRTTEVSEALCLSCHDSWEVLAEKTADVTILTDTNGTTVNPHEVKTSVNTVGQHDEITCTSCHKMHTSDGIEATATNACQSCHHMDVYECGTCHDVG